MQAVPSRSNNQESSDEESVRSSRSPSIYDDELAVQINTIKVLGSKITNDEGGSYTTYNVVTELSDGNTWNVWRRYKEFEALHAEIKRDNLIASRPSLPQKKWIGNLDAKFIEKRTKDLETYLCDVLRSPNGQRLFPLRNLLTPALRADWPSSIGPINLGEHDGPHKSSVTEWWYYNSHVTTDTGVDLSIFAAFFRICKHVDPKTGKKSYAHALNWAISDTKNKTYTSDILLDRDSPQMVLKQIKEGKKQVGDKKLRAAMREVLEKGNVPLPDRMFKKDANVPFGKLNLDYENATVTKRSDGAYIVNALHSDGEESGFSLAFLPQKPAVRHGKDGVVAGHDGDDMFYYFIPRCEVTGTVKLNGETQTITKGQGWYDHEFGGKMPEEGADRMNYAWNWAAVQLDNKYEITAAILVNPENGELMETRTVTIDPKGRRYKSTDMQLLGSDVWTSVKTFRSFPTAWNLKIPSDKTDLMLVADFPDQEFVTLIAKPSYWEGRCTVTGTFRGEKVTGIAYVERNGFDKMPDLGAFFKNVGKQVRQSVQDMYPDMPTREQARDLIATKDTDYYLKGVPMDVLQKTLIAPVREIADRGGKSWRSYGALACCDVVGGDSRQFVKWLAMPEFMHVGSLIVDDIQDKSEERRGGKCAHLIYGEPLSINAGTAAYFMCEHLIKAPGLSADTLNKVYQLYFSCLRGGHAGQALDIYGLDYLMPEAIEKGESAVLEERSLAIHMLKTAVPAGTLARMGALVGGGTPEQVEAVGKYFEGVGLAFQIMDDVLNLRGLFFNAKIDQSAEEDATANVVTEIFGRDDQKAKLKEQQKGKKKKAMKVLGEDIMCGKVTMPVAKAMGLMGLQQRQKLWKTIESKPQDQATVNQVIKELEDVGAVQECVVQANKLVEDAWAALDPIVPDSFSKMMLRSFGWFVVRR
jgi:geranylgeranyl pyrophosphate synthase/predicted secreted hydrolase